MNQFIARRILLLPALYLLMLLSAQQATAQSAPTPYGPLPIERQLRWQETELYCIIHFSLPTYTDKEWGYGDESPTLFAPTHFNTDSILSTVKAAGFKAAIIVAKHHDGFCLWPTKTTTHNITQSPYQNGHGDLLREYRQAATKAGLQLGIYCSPWDRNNPLYGQAGYTTGIYQHQLQELYTTYGPFFMAWFDGANGGDGYYGGKRSTLKIDKATYNQWDTTWQLVRSLQPTASIFGDAGPDVRWIGNEEGLAGETSWETYTPVAAEGTIPSNGNTKYQDGITGTRNGRYWMPAECDVPLRRGWFYHAADDGRSKTPAQLLSLYYNSVGRSACLDIGIAPDKSGRLTAADAQTLQQIGTLLSQTFAHNGAKGASYTATNTRNRDTTTYSLTHLTDTDRYSYWATDDSVTHATITISLPQPTAFNIIRLRENIKLGQRIDSIRIEEETAGTWAPIATATSIGACRLIRLPHTITTSKLRLTIAAPVCITLSDFGLFREAEVSPTPTISYKKKGIATPTKKQYTGTCTIPLSGYKTVKGFTYTPPTTTSTIATHYTCQLSKDGTHWHPLASGEFPNIIANPVMQSIPLTGLAQHGYLRILLLDNMGKQVQRGVITIME